MNSDNTSSAENQAPSLSAIFDVESATALVEHGRDRSAIPLNTISPEWAKFIHISDLQPSDVPGPHKFETIPLRRAIRAADLILIILFHEDVRGVFGTQARRQDILFTIADVWNHMQRRKAVTVVKTRWEWLAPWEARLHDEALPGTEITVVDGAGARRLQFRRRGHSKRLRSRT